MADIGEKEKLIKLIEYWLNHNKEHLRENIEWRKKAGELGLDDVVHGLSHIIEYSIKINDEFDNMLKSLREREHQGRDHGPSFETHEHEHITLHPIGIIKTPFSKNIPSEGKWKDYECSITIDESLEEALYGLEAFSHLYVLFYMHRLEKSPGLRVKPPSGRGIEVGVFASRSPGRPNPLGLTITEIRRIQGNVIYTGGIDALDGSPLLDIKPYIKTHDCVEEANDGWLSSGS